MKYLSQREELVIPKTLIDKTIQYWFPRWSQKRTESRIRTAWGEFFGQRWGLGGFIGARQDRRATRAWITQTSTADDALLPDLHILRNRSRDLLRNAPLAVGAVNTVVQNVIGSGLALQCRPDPAVLGMDDAATDSFKAKVESEFSLWAESSDCDVTRTQTFYALQALVFRSTLESGDCFVLLPMVARNSSPYDLCLEVIEADFVMNAFGTLDSVSSRMGIDYDQMGAPKAYHVRKYHPASSMGFADSSETVVPAFGSRSNRRNILHIFDRTRPGQTRGYPYLAPVIEPLKQLDRYTEAEMMAAVISSMFTVFITTPTGEGLSSFTQPPANTDGSVAKASAAEVALSSGAIIDLMPGEDPKFANPGRPNALFDPFVQSILRQIGVALSIPFEVLIKHYTASYSAARAAILEAWTFFINRRAFMAQNFCQPVYEAWFDEAVSLGRIDAPGFLQDPARRRAYLQTEWIGAAQTQIDPEKEVGAAEKRINVGVSSLADETLLLTGRIWEDEHRQQVKERKARVRDGLVSPVPPMPSGLQIPSASGGGNPQPAGSDAEQPDNAPQGVTK